MLLAARHRRKLGEAAETSRRDVADGGCGGDWWWSEAATEEYVLWIAGKSVILEQVLMAACLSKGLGRRRLGRSAASPLASGGAQP